MAQVIATIGNAPALLRSFISQAMVLGTGSRQSTCTYIQISGCSLVLEPIIISILGKCPAHSCAITVGNRIVLRITLYRMQCHTGCCSAVRCTPEACTGFYANCIVTFSRNDHVGSTGFQIAGLSYAGPEGAFLCGSRCCHRKGGNPVGLEADAGQTLLCLLQLALNGIGLECGRLLVLCIAGLISQTVDRCIGYRSSSEHQTLSVGCSLDCRCCRIAFRCQQEGLHAGSGLSSLAVKHWLCKLHLHRNLCILGQLIHRALGYQLHTVVAGAA